MNSKNKSNKKCWDKNAKFYDRVIKKDRKTYEKVCETILQKVEDKNILEVGTGTGIISLKIAKSAKSVYAIDFSKKMINEAKKKKNPYGVKFLLGDATKLSYEAESFDIVVISNCLHIMPYPEKVLSEIYRILKNDGILYAPNFCHKGQIKAKILSLTSFFTGFKTFNKWTPEEYICFLENNNFKVVKHKTYKASFKLEMTINKKDFQYGF